MELDWSKSSYRDIVNSCMGKPGERRTRGAVKSLAEKLRCHTTFVAQVLSGKSNFSVEQAFEICDYFSFNSDEQTLFILLLMRDRAGTVSLKNYWQSKINEELRKRSDIKTRIRADEVNLGQHELEYFGNWIYQTIHALTQLKDQTLATLSKHLRLASDEVSFILSSLESMGLVKREKSTWASTKNFLHLSRSSRLTRLLHLSWRGKIMSDLQSNNLDQGTHYSGVITISTKDQEKIREIILNALSAIKKKVSDSPSESAHVLAIDFYPL